MIKLENIAKSIKEDKEDISFEIDTQKVPVKPGVLSHEIITIGTFEIPEVGTVQFQPYRLIFGANSLAIFDAFKTNEVAGLTRQECEEHIKNLPNGDETNNAYIAGLSNWAGDQAFQFFNVARIKKPGMANRVLSHESLHVARMLISLFKNDFLRQNQGKPDWWKDERAAFTNMQDENEEFFAETLERVTGVAYSRWQKVS